MLGIVLCAYGLLLTGGSAPWRASRCSRACFATEPGEETVPHPGESKGIPLRTDDGYRGVWYLMQKMGDYYKYSGGLGTYPQQIRPLAVYAPEVRKTFFVYGGTVKGRQHLLHMISYYDHARGVVPRPRILMDKKTADAHDNPSLAIDADGHLWVFSNAHGTARPAYIWRSVKPYDIDRFEQVLETNFSYGQPWWVPGKGFMFVHTIYHGGKRFLYWQTSADGRTWSRRRALATIARGQYQISEHANGKVATAFNVHPQAGGLDNRTNLYYLETTDFGETWRTADGTVVKTPLTAIANPALVQDFRAEGLRVYLKDLRFDADGRPVILFLTADTHVPGPRDVPRTWRTARWTGTEWEIHPFTTSDNNYDFGPLYLEEGGVWKVIGPTEPGPQRFCTGGEIALWTSPDRGKSWRKVKQLTHDSPRNHTYVRRPVNARDDFYAFWADGDALKTSDSHLYFTNRAGTKVRRLPMSMEGDFAEPEVVSFK